MYRADIIKVNIIFGCMSLVRNNYILPADSLGLICLGVTSSINISKPVSEEAMQAQAITVALPPGPIILYVLDHEKISLEEVNPSSRAFVAYICISLKIPT